MTYSPEETRPQSADQQIASLIDMMNEIATQNEKILTRLDALAAVAHVETIPFTEIGLCDLPEMHHLELSFFDNGVHPGKGNSRYKMVIEVNKTKKLAGRRDIKLVANLQTFVPFKRAVTSSKNVSEENRAEIVDVLNCLEAEQSSYLFGMISKKGGKKGSVFYDRQYLIVKYIDSEISAIMTFTNHDYLR